MRKPLRRQVRGDDSLIDSHRQQQQFEAGDSPNQGVRAAKRTVCRKTRSRDSPSDRRGTRPSGNFRRRACCERPRVGPLSRVLSVPILWGTLVHRQYLPDKDHVPGCTSSSNSLALAV